MKTWGKHDRTRTVLIYCRGYCSLLRLSPDGERPLRILFLDIETAPNVAHVWGLFQQNVGLPQIIDSGYVMCWAAKWRGEDEVMFDSFVNSGRRTMLRRVHKLLDESDAVVHYNGTRFDIPTLNKEFLQHEMGPPAPSKQIDLLRVSRSQFRFTSNKLDYVSQALGFEGKVRNRGHQLWIDCMNKDEAAWKEMETYNRQDVVLLEQVYDRFLPWIKNHPNVGLYNAEGETLVCPNCGGYHYQRRGIAFTKSYKYQRYQCLDCRSWFQGGENLAPPPAAKFRKVA